MLTVTVASGLLSPVALADTGHGRPQIHDHDRTVTGHSLGTKPALHGAPVTNTPLRPSVWPTAGSATVTVPASASGAVRAGALPVQVTAPDRSHSQGKGGLVALAGQSAGKVNVQVLDQNTTRAAGLGGPVVTLSRADGAGIAGAVGVRLDYRSFAQGMGGEYGSRLRLVQYPACVLTTPKAPQCRNGVALPTANDTRAKTLTATVNAAPASLPSNSPNGNSSNRDVRGAASQVAAASAAGMTVLAAEAGTSGDQGDLKATSLSESSTWQVGAQTGTLNWSYPMRVPPVPGGLSPKVEISYDSGQIDGRTSTTNNQASWVGDGFELWPGYIERRYKSCADDGAPQDDGGNDPGDQCWGYDNATITWDGKGGQLIPDGNGKWHLKRDDGTRIEKLNGTDDNTGNGSHGNEYWKVTTPNGTQYFFGKNRADGWSKGDPETQSTWNVPVFGNKAGTPCHKDDFKDSWCQQAWRWNLDMVIDPRGNEIVYYYTPETNYYGRDLKKDDKSQYTRGGWLDHIEYGLRTDHPYAKAPARVDFTTSERCIPDSGFDCAPDKIAGHRDKWPDVPWDMNCTGDKDSDHDCEKFHGSTSPTFWSRKWLSNVTTKVLGSDGSTYRDVDSWALTHKWGTADPATSMLLDSVQHTGLAGGSPITLPKTQLTYSDLANRVKGQQDDAGDFRKYRLSGIVTEFGSQVSVNYNSPQCTPSSLPKPESNDKLCFPTYWPHNGSKDPNIDWFHKYVVTSTSVTDRTGYAPNQVTTYTYGDGNGGGAAWHYADDDGLSKTSNDDGTGKQLYKTWSQWRGYSQVKVVTGGQGTPRSETDHIFFRGMDGDRLNSDGGKKTATVSDGEGNSYTDHESLEGFELKSTVLDSAGGKPVTKTITLPWHHQTATRVRPWGTVSADYVHPDTVRTLGLLDDGTWREKTRVHNTYDDATGQITMADDHADGAGDKCTRTTYTPPNTDAWMISYVSRVETVAVGCDQTPNRVTGKNDTPGDVISDVRTFYDDAQHWNTAPTKGLAVRSDRLASHPTATDVTYQTTKTTGYDDYGRPVTSTDAAGGTTSTSYTDTAGLTTRVSTTTPPATSGDDSTRQTSYNDLDPAWGSPLAETNVAGKTTTLQYDALGRLIKVWQPDRHANRGDTPSTQYGYQITDGQIVAVSTQTVTNDQGKLSRPSITLYDGQLRPRQTQAPGPNGGRLITDTLYNDLGKTDRTYDTYYATGDPTPALFGVDQSGEVDSQTRYTYDGLGRVTRTALREGAGDVDERWHTTTSYGSTPTGDWVRTDPPTGGTPSMTVTDTRGQKTELHQYGPDGIDDVTRYTYTPSGQTATITGPQRAGDTSTTPEMWAYTYDQRGRKIADTDPDRGDSTYRYNDLDQLTQTTDARGKTIAVGYDGLGRQVTQTDITGGGSGTVLTSRSYDTVQIGQLSSTTRYAIAPDGSTAAYSTRIGGYDVLGRATSSIVSIPSVKGEEGLKGDYRFTVGYNPDGTLRGTGLPAAGDLSGESTSIAYDELQRPIRLTGSANSYVTGAVYTLTGKAGQYELSTGGSKTWLTYNYETGTQRLHEARVDRENVPGTDQDTIYSYDDSGNITTQTDTSRAGVDTQCFRYDYLTRLTDAWTPKPDTDACNNAPGLLGGLAGAQYRSHYTYNLDGTRKQEQQYDTAGNLTSTHDYSYATDKGYASAGVKGHMLGEVRVTGTSNQNETYSYDQTGNTLRRVIGGRTQDFTWNTEGNLSSVHDSSTGDSSYVYSPDGSRLIQRDVAGTTLYLPGMELHLAKGAVSPTVTRYYNFGSRTVAMRTATGVTFLAADPHGSAQIAVDGTDNTKISQRRYTPFGAERGGTSGIWPTTMTRGFVGGIKDNTGLINLGAREYDPANGRFISVDPAFDTSDPQSWSGYTYASNNPVTRSDPTGLSWWDDALDDGEDFISGFDNSIMDLPAPLIDPFTGGGYSDWVNNTWPVEGVAGNLGQMTGLVGPLFTGLGEAGDALELPDLLGGGAKTGETVPEAGGKADASEPANPKPDAPESNTPKPDAPKPDAPKPDAPKPDTPKPDAPEPAPKASDPGPSKPEPAPNGKATVHLHPPKDVNDGIGHASIQVEYDGDVLHTHQVAPQGVGGKTLAREWKGDLPEGTRSFEFDLPNGGGALARMEVDLARSQGSNRVGLGAYDFGTNSCVTFCANVLKAGGVPGVPDNSGDVLMWLLDYK